MAIPIPKGLRTQIKSAQSWGEFNRWSSDVDATLTDIIDALGRSIRAVNHLTEASTEASSPGLVPHSASHMPAGSDPLTTVAAAFTLGTAGAEGSSNAFVRSDATIAAFDATNPAGLSGTAATGSVAKAARRDHVHDAFNTDLPQSIGSAAAGSTDFAARIDHVHPIDDLVTGPSSSVDRNIASYSNTSGDIEDTNSWWIWTGASLSFLPRVDSSYDIGGKAGRGHPGAFALRSAYVDTIIPGAASGEGCTGYFNSSADGTYSLGSLTGGGSLPAVGGGFNMAWNSIVVRDGVYQKDLTGTEYSGFFLQCDTESLTTGRGMQWDQMDADFIIKWTRLGAVGGTENIALADWFNQSVKTTAGPTFAGAILTNVLVPNTTGATTIGTSALGFSEMWFYDAAASQEAKLFFSTSGPAVANYTCQIDCVDTSRVLTLSGNATLVAGTMVPTTLTLTAGEALTGGGDLSANRTFAVDIDGLSELTLPDRTADMMMVYDADAGTHKKMLMRRVSVESDKYWAFDSPSGGSGTFYFGGFYDFASSDNDFNPVINWGTANSPYAAHVLFVAAAGGAGGTDTVVRVTGTSFADDGTRTAADTEDVTLDDAGAAGAYYETAKKWIGLVTIEKQSGPDLLCNYGWAKYWDFGNTDFKVVGWEATWLGGATDTGADILVRHHKASGWTYNAASTPTPPTALGSMQTEYATEFEVQNGENGAYKRALAVGINVSGSASEGTLIEVVTTANKAFELGTLQLSIEAT
jgi:hypothetical protein